jgi:hypothetical protein
VQTITAIAIDECSAAAVTIFDATFVPYDRLLDSLSRGWLSTRLRPTCIYTG